jgi:hypothetical protein
VATWADVRRIALALPEVVEDGPNSYRVRKKPVVWERPLRRQDLAHLGADAPTGPVACARTADEGVKLALVADDPAAFFTTPHFDGYPAVLIRLDEVDVDALAEVVEESWLRQAPKRLAAAYLADRA